MVFEVETSTVQREKEFPLKRTVDALEFPRKSTDTQPPPATELREAVFCSDCRHDSQRAVIGNGTVGNADVRHLKSCNCTAPHGARLGAPVVVAARHYSSNCCVARCEGAVMNVEEHAAARASCTHSAATSCAAIEEVTMRHCDAAAGGHGAAVDAEVGTVQKSNASERDGRVADDEGITPGQAQPPAAVEKCSGRHTADDQGCSVADNDCGLAGAKTHVGGPDELNRVGDAASYQRGGTARVIAGLWVDLHCNG